MKLRTVTRTAVRGKRVIVRVDFDVAMRRGRIVDDFRIREALPTIRLIIRSGGSPRLVAHLGRPGGTPSVALSLAPIARRLERLLGERVTFVADPFDRESWRRYDLAAGILLFENIRFWPDEERNGGAFARRLARWGDCFVNDAFAVSHRAHASVAGLARLLPAYAGLHLADEVRNLSYSMQSPRHPIVAVIGGAKISTKLPLIRRLLKTADRVIVVGALANSILAWKGVSVGSSAVEHLSGAEERFIIGRRNLYLPIDFTTVASAGGRAHTRRLGEVTAGERIVDVGPASVRLLRSLVADARTVIWNGPIGLVEVPQFARSSIALARAVARSPAFSVIGGGDTIAALRTAHALRGFNHVSTGGGAMMEFLSGKKFPALAALRQ